LFYFQFPLLGSEVQAGVILMKPALVFQFPLLGSN